jgi:hypothetical protein
MSGLLKGCLIGCAVAAVLGILAVVAIGAWLASIAKTQEQVQVRLDVPAEARVGSEIELIVEVMNQREDDVFHLTDIDLEDSYLDGFTLISVEPEPKSTESVDLLDVRSHSFDRDLAAGAVERFTFRLKAVEAGTWTGDVDVWEGLSCITQVAQTRVLETPQAPSETPQPPPGTPQPPPGTAP